MLLLRQVNIVLTSGRYLNTTSSEKSAEALIGQTFNAGARPLSLEGEFLQGGLAYLSQRSQLKEMKVTFTSETGIQSCEIGMNSEYLNFLNPDTWLNTALKRFSAVPSFVITGPDLSWLKDSEDENHNRHLVLANAQLRKLTEAIKTSGKRPSSPFDASSNKLRWLMPFIDQGHAEEEGGIAGQLEDLRFNDDESFAQLWRYYNSPRLASSISDPVCISLLSAFQSISLLHPRHSCIIAKYIRIQNHSLNQIRCRVLAKKRLGSVLRSIDWS